MAIFSPFLSQCINMATQKPDYEMRHFTLQMRPITPVAVGAGEMLNAGIDYWVAPEGVRILKSRVFSAAIESQNLADDFGQFVANSNLDVQVGEFLKAHAMDVDQFSYLIPNFGLNITERRQMSRVMHSGGRPYLPGSTLKGAIRTALLFYWLEKYTLGWQEREKMVNKLLDLKPKADEFLREGSKMSSRFAQDLLSAIFDESILFGPIKDNRPDSQHFLVGDSEPGNMSALAAYLYDRIWLEPETEEIGDEGDAPTTAMEAIRHDVQNVQFPARLSLRYPDITRNKFLADTMKKPETITEVLNHFTYANIDEEYLFFEGADKMDAAERRQIMDFYDELGKRMEANPEKSYVRIGKGKTFYNNTLGLLMIRYAADLDAEGKKEQAKKVKQAWGIWRALAARIPYDQTFWPNTRTVVRLKDRTVLPAGWMEVNIVPQP